MVLEIASIAGGPPPQAHYTSPPSPSLWHAVLPPPPLSCPPPDYYIHRTTTGAALPTGQYNWGHTDVPPWRMHAARCCTAHIHTRSHYSRCRRRAVAEAPEPPTAWKGSVATRYSIGGQIDSDWPSSLIPRRGLTTHARLPADCSHIYRPSHTRALCVCCDQTHRLSTAYCNRTAVGAVFT